MVSIIMLYQFVCFYVRGIMLAFFYLCPFERSIQPGNGVWLESQGDLDCVSNLDEKLFWKQFLNNFYIFPWLSICCFSTSWVSLPLINSFGSIYSIGYVVFSLLRSSKHSVIAFLISFQWIIFLKKSHKNFPRAWLFFDLHFCNYFIVVLQCGHRMWWK